MLSNEEKDNVFKISVPIITNEELERIDYTIENDLDNIVHQISETVSRDRDIIILKKVIEKQSKEIEELKENNKKLTDEYLIQKDLINPDFLKDYISKEKSGQRERKAYIKGTNDADKLCNKKWKDKIKAKIEAIKTNKLRYFHIAPENWAINILQSLLEKE